MPTDEQANFARIKGGATKLPDLRIFQSLQIGARPAALTDALRFTILLELRRVFFAQFRTQNRCALLLELLFLRNSGRKTATHFCWNCFSYAIPDAKPLRTFAGIAFLTQFRTQNRCALLLELL